MTQDQLVGWLIVAAILNGGAWAWVAVHIRTLRDQLSKERLYSASLRERLEPMHNLWQSGSGSASMK